MSSWAKFVMLLLTAMVSTSWVMALPEGLEALGRPATEGEVSAWDIDVRPDFAGLPPGSGDVWAGEEIWLAQCASCHGDFGDSNEILHRSCWAISRRGISLVGGWPPSQIQP